MQLNKKTQLLMRKKQINMWNTTKFLGIIFNSIIRVFFNKKII